MILSLAPYTLLVERGELGRWPELSRPRSQRCTVSRQEDADGLGGSFAAWNGNDAG
jgi:hypothetical protein